MSHSTARGSKDPHFKIIAKDGSARSGVLKTAHGDIKTPVFMPVGTQASVKALSPDDLKDAGAQVILGNTYHLYLRPGSKLVKKMGGLHKFMNWNGPILTDSGGFQAFSLGAMIADGVRKVPKKGIDEQGSVKGEGAGNNTIRLDISNYINVDNSSYNVKTPREKSSEGERELLIAEYPISNVKYPIKPQGEKRQILSRIKEDGIEFTSHLDGSRHFLSPATSIKVQLDLGSDIVLVLDELLSPLSTPEYVEESLKRTHIWELESQKYFKKHLKNSTNPGALLFGIVQGVFDQEIREKEARWCAQQGFDGFSIGGSYGSENHWRGDENGPEEKQMIAQTIEWITPLLPESLPRHALGIGEVEDFFECIERGIDMFDCVAPTRRARNGSLYISPKNGGKKESKFTLSIQRSEYSDDPNPIDPGCKCYTCQNFSRSYLRHLYQAKEILFHRLATIHNVYFMLHLVDQIRESIENKQFQKLKKAWLK